MQEAPSLPWVYCVFCCVLSLSLSLLAKAAKPIKLISGWLRHMNDALDSHSFMLFCLSLSLSLSLSFRL